LSAQSGVINVFKRKISEPGGGTSEPWTCLVTDHGKYAVSLANGYVCFGDANQGWNQISHAGIAVCILHVEGWFFIIKKNKLSLFFLKKKFTDLLCATSYS
jgi:hypothetical protein